MRAYIYTDTRNTFYSISSHRFKMSGRAHLKPKRFVTRRNGADENAFNYKLKRKSRRTEQLNSCSRSPKFGRIYH